MVKVAGRGTREIVGEWFGGVGKVLLEKRGTGNVGLGRERLDGAG